MFVQRESSINITQFSVVPTGNNCNIVPDLVRVAVVAPIGNSDHSSLLQSSRWLRQFQTIVWVGKFSWNIKLIGMLSVVQYGNCIGETFGFLTVEVLNEHLSLTVGCYVPTKVICVWNKDKPWFDDQCRHAFRIKQEAHLQWTRDRSRVKWDEFVHCKVRANETYWEAKRQFSNRNRDVLMNVQSPHKWWSTLKYAVFC